MTDPDLVAKKLSLIESCVTELRRLARVDRIEDDLREQRFILHTLQIAIQAAMDTASQIVSDERLGEPATHAELFDLLARHGYVSEEVAGLIRPIVGFRNVLVHGYQEVDLGIVRDVVDHHLPDLLAFVEAIRTRLDL